MIPVHLHPTKQTWQPTHHMTDKEYNIAIDVLDMLTDYEAISLDDYAEIRSRIDRMVE